MFDAVVRSEAIRRIFRGEEGNNEIVLKLMEINMPNIILLISNAPKHEIRHRLKLINSSNTSKERTSEEDRLRLIVLRYLVEIDYITNHEEIEIE